MSNQLPLNFSDRPPSLSQLTDEYPGWLDVSEITTGVGFSEPVSISPALSDALEPNQLETEADYDQRLYDALWREHFELSLNDGQPTNFTFTFSRVRWKTDEITEARLRLHVERQPQGIYLGLWEDF
jgi:hypothetical protein